jgi:hypothetical protein
VEKLHDAGGWGNLAGWGRKALGVGFYTGFTEVVGIILGQLNLEASQWVTSDHVLAREELHVVQAEVTQSCMPRFRGDTTQTMLMCCALRVFAPLDRCGVGWDVISGQRTGNKPLREVVGVRVLLRPERSM